MGGCEREAVRTHPFLCILRLATPLLNRALDAPTSSRTIGVKAEERTDGTALYRPKNC